MTRAQYSRRLAGLALIAALAACSSPNPALYTIAPVTGPELNAGPKVILLQQVAVERYLERLQIVRSSESFRLDVMSNDWWGEPLSAMLARVLVSELGQRLPRSVVFSESGAVSAQPDATIAVNIQRLDEEHDVCDDAHEGPGVGVVRDQLEPVEDAVLADRRQRPVEAPAQLPELVPHREQDRQVIGDGVPDNHGGSRHAGPPLTTGASLRDRRMVSVRGCPASAAGGRLRRKHLSAREEAG